MIIDQVFVSMSVIPCVPMHVYYMSAMVDDNMQPCMFLCDYLWLWSVYLCECSWVNYRVTVYVTVCL